MKLTLAAFLALLVIPRLVAVTISFSGSVALSSDPASTGVNVNDTAFVSYETGVLQSTDILPGGLEFWYYESTMDLELGSYQLMDESVLVTLFTSPFGTFFNASFYPDLVKDGLSINHLAFSEMASALENGLLPTSFPSDGFVTNDLAFNNFNLPGLPLIVASFDSVQVGSGTQPVNDTVSTLLLAAPLVGLAAMKRRRVAARA